MMQNKPMAQIEALYIDTHMEAEHREETGSFYTPYRLARWMVYKSVSLIGASNQDETPADIWKRLCELKVADIASGTGVFLMAWLDFLADQGRQIHALENITTDEFSEGLRKAAAGILAVDIHKEALQTFERLVKERHGIESVRTLATNALKDDFMAHPLIVEILESGGLDLIFGNPPYIGEKGNRPIFDDLRDQDLYSQYYVAKMDYWYFFLHRAESLLKPNGILAYLVSSYFVTADGASKLRTALQHMTCHTLVDFTENSLFEAAKGHHSMAIFLSPQASQQDAEIIRISKSKGIKVSALYEALYNESQENPSIKRYKKKQNLLYLKNGYMSLMEEAEDEVYKRLVGACQWTLGELCHINQGIVSGLDSSRIDGSSVFVLDEVALQRLDTEVNRDLIQHFYKNSDIEAYKVSSQSNKYILYLDGIEQNFEATHPDVIQHLTPYRAILEQRRECRSGKRPWYALQWPRKKAVFEGPKLVVPHRASRNRFAFTDKPFYGSADIYYISVREGLKDLKPQVVLNYLMALLNSRVYNFLLIKSGKVKGDILELYATPLKKLPVYLPAHEEIVKIAEMAHLATESAQASDFKKMVEYTTAIEMAICGLYNIDSSDRVIIDKVVRIWRKEDGANTEKC